MPNVFTRVPERAVPELPAWARALLPVADRFMVVMVSRPPTGTLASTWVTPATLQLCSTLTVVCAVTSVFLLVAQGLRASLPAALVGAVLLLFALGCASVALVGFAQRRAPFRD